MWAKARGYNYVFSCGGSNRAKILKYRICVMGAVGRKKLNIHGGIIRLILLTVFFQIFQTITDGFIFKNYWKRYINISYSDSELVHFFLSIM